MTEPTALNPEQRHRVLTRIGARLETYRATLRALEAYHQALQSPWYQAPRPTRRLAAQVQAAATHMQQLADLLKKATPADHEPASPLANPPHN
jgi:ribonuclease D